MQNATLRTGNRPGRAARSFCGFTPAGRVSFVFAVSFFILSFALFATAATPKSAPAKPGEAKSEPVKSEPAKSEATAPVVLPPPPQSVFVIPKKATEGKDPFFPNATRVYNADAPVQQKGPAVSVGELSLKGISGTAAEPLAIINTTTFTTGEENDVITTAGRMRVRCLEINMALGTVLVQVGGERRELRLRPVK